MRPFVLTVIMALCAFAASAQAPLGANRIVLATDYGSVEEAMSDVILYALPSIGLEPDWIDKDYGIVRTRVEFSRTYTGICQYFIQIKQTSSVLPVEIEVSGHAAMQQGFLDRVVKQKGMKDSFNDKSWRELEAVAEALPHTSISYR